MSNLQGFEDVFYAARNRAGIIYCEATHSAQFNPTSTIVSGIALALVLANRIRAKAERIEIPGGLDGFLDAARNHMLEYDLMASSFNEHNKAYRVSEEQLSLQKDIPSTAKRFNGTYPKPVFDWIVGYLAVADWLVSSFKSDFGFPTSEKSLLLQGLFLRHCDTFYETFVLMAGGEPLKDGEIANSQVAPQNAVIPREICQQLVEICKKGDIKISALTLVFGWPGQHEPIFRGDAFVMASAMAAHFRYVCEGNENDRKDDNPFIGECLKDKCRDFEKYAPGMFQVLQGHTISDGLERLVRDAVLSFKYDNSERVSRIVRYYGLLALWAAKTVFPPSSLIQGEQGQISVISEFAKSFDEDYKKWKEILVQNHIVTN